MASFRDLKTNKPIEPQDYVPPSGLGELNPFQKFTTESHARWAAPVVGAPAVFISLRLTYAMLDVFSQSDQIPAAGFMVPWLIGVCLILIAAAACLWWAAWKWRQLWAGVLLLIWGCVDVVQQLPNFMPIVGVGAGILGLRALIALRTKPWLKVETAPLTSG